MTSEGGHEDLLGFLTSMSLSMPLLDKDEETGNTISDFFASFETRDTSSGFPCSADNYKKNTHFKHQSSDHNLSFLSLSEENGCIDYYEQESAFAETRDISLTRRNITNQTNASNSSQSAHKTTMKIKTNTFETTDVDTTSPITSSFNQSSDCSEGNRRFDHLNSRKYDFSSSFENRDSVGDNSTERSSNKHERSHSWHGEPSSNLAVKGIRPKHLPLYLGTLGHMKRNSYGSDSLLTRSSVKCNLFGPDPPSTSDFTERTPPSNQLRFRNTKSTFNSSSNSSCSAKLPPSVFYPLQTSTPMSSPRGNQSYNNSPVLKNTSKNLCHVTPKARRMLYFQNEDEEAVFYLIDKYLKDNKENEF